MTNRHWMDQDDVFHDRVVGVDEIHSNVSPEILEITLDKLKIVLLENQDSLRKNTEWQTPLALLVTIITVFVTANFKSVLFLSSDTWAAIFVISGFISFIWLVKSLLNRTSQLTVDELIDCMKKKA